LIVVQGFSTVHPVSGFDKSGHAEMSAICPLSYGRFCKWAMGPFVRFALIATELMRSSHWRRYTDCPRSMACVSSSTMATPSTDLSAPHLSPADINLARSALSDPDPMVRIGALDMLANASPSQIWPLVAPLLSDSIRGVRIRAAALLALLRRFVDA
jgi:hypothetical protein